MIKDEAVRVFPLTTALLLLSAFAPWASTSFAASDEAPQPATRAAIRGDGTLLVDGVGVFPIGVRSEKLDTIGPIAETGFNLVLGSGEWDADHYKAAAEHDLLVLAGHYVWLTFHGTKSEIDVRAREEALLKSVATSARDFKRRRIHDALGQFDALPGVIGWCISDEPEAKLSEIAECGYELFKSNTPAHLVAQISCDPHWFKNFRNATDILIVDHYPFRGSANVRSRQSVLQTYERIRQAVEEMDGKPVWLMPQLYPPSYWSCISEEELTLQDMRQACYAGLIGGAKGILLYHWGVLSQAWSRDESGSRVSVAVSPEVFARRVGDVKALVGELKRLGPIVSNGRPANDLVVRWLPTETGGPSPQAWRVWDYDGRRYLMVENFLDVPIEGDVLGVNAAINAYAYEASVFAGPDHVSLAPPQKPGEVVFRVVPRGAGVVELQRRPIVRQEKE